MTDTTSHPTPTETETTTAPEATSAAQTDAGTSSSTEGQAPQEEAAKPFRPWEEEKAQEAEEAGKIPYSRFKEINEERKAHQSRVQELETELAQYRSRSEELSKIKTPDDIKPGDYKTPEEFLKARDEAIKNAAIKEVEERFIQREAQRIEAERNHQIVSRFEKNVEDASKANPEIREAVSFLDKYAHNLPAAVARELLEDENAARVIHAIVTDQQSLEKLFRGRPEDSIRMIHRMSARLEGTPAAASSPASQGTVEVPQALKSAGVPVTVKGGVSKVPVTTIKADTSMADYRAWKAQQTGRKS